MFLKVLILLSTLTAHFWLWGHWSLNKTTEFSLGLVGASVLLLFLVIYPTRCFMKNQGFKDIYGKTWIRVLSSFYILSVLVLSLMSFSGLLMYLLPVNIALILSYAYFKLKLKGMTKK